MPSISFRSFEFSYVLQIIFLKQVPKQENVQDLSQHLSAIQIKIGYTLLRSFKKNLKIQAIAWEDKTQYENQDTR